MKKHFLLSIFILTLSLSVQGAEPVVTFGTFSWGNCTTNSDIGLNQEVFVTVDVDIPAIVTIEVMEGGFREEAFRARWDGVEGEFIGNRTKIGTAFITPSDSAKIYIKDGGTTWPSQMSGYGADICVTLIDAIEADCFLHTVSFDKNPLPQGETGESFVEIEETGDETCDVEWAIVGETLDCVIDAQTGEITASCEMGVITVRAFLVSDSSIYAEKDLVIGTGACSSGCGNMGGSNHSLGSINSLFHLGRGENGESAGSIRLHTAMWSPQLLHPGALQYSTQRSDIEVLRDEYSTLRQIKTPEGLADVAVTAVNEYQILFYTNQFSALDVDGYYDLSGATPFISYAIDSTGDVSNPFADKSVRITEARAGVTNLTEYLLDPGSVQDWSLVTGGGLRKEVLDITTTTNGQTEVRSVFNDNDTLAYEVEQTFVTNTSFGKQLVEEIIDPDGAALTSSNQYDASSGRLTNTVEHSGFERSTHYNANGLRDSESSTWLDSGERTRSNEYASTGIDLYRPRTVEERINGVLTRKTTTTISTNSAGERVEVMERYHSQAAISGAAENLITTNIYYSKDLSTPWAGDLKKTIQPDLQQTRFEYEQGHLSMTNASTGTYGFTAGTGSYIRAISTHGTLAATNGLAGKSTRDIRIRNGLGREIVSETEVYTGSGYALIHWQVQEYDAYGNRTKTYQDDGTYTASDWSLCCGREWDEDRLGIRTTYSYDDLRRVSSTLRSGITESYTFDAQGRQLTRTRTAGGLSLSSTNEYDVAGRLTKTIDENGLQTTWSYSADGLTVTNTLPGNRVTVTENYIDGQSKRISGNGVVEQAYTYGVEVNGHQWTTIYTGPDGTNSPQWEKTLTDLLGRTIKTERTGFQGILLATEYEYNNLGQLVSTQELEGGTPVKPKTIYEYDTLGQQTASGLDVNENDQLDRVSMDRITENEQSIEPESGDQWRITINRIFPENNSATVITNSIQKERLTGWSGTTVSEIKSIDLFGNETIQTRELIRSNHVETARTDTPASSQDSVQTYIQGLLVSQTSPSGLIYSNQYDALQRQTVQIQPNGGQTHTVYENNRVLYIQDALSNRTHYAYNAAGEQSTITNALNDVTYFEYNSLGNLTNQWGSASYPVQYQYNDLGWQTAMTTWRDDAGAGDTTTWHYDQASGLMTNKVYADGNGTAYTYTPDGQLETRTWERGITTTYSYDPMGSLTNTAYSDSTPDITITVDRLGRQAQITQSKTPQDGVIHQFDYDPNTLILTNETRIAYGQTNTLARKYDPLGRPAGFSLENDYAVDYGRNSYGQLSSVSSSVASVQSVVNYSYTSDSDLINSLTMNHNSTEILKVRKDYDLLNRLSLISNSNTLGTVSSYTYEHDALGRRTNRVQAAGDQWRYGYNSRSEVTSGKRYWPDGDPVKGQHYEYNFDDIGNRLTATRDGQASIYTANELNQYSNKIVPGIHHILGEAESNATVTINFQPTDRKDGYFHKGLAIDNSSEDVYREYAVTGVKNNAGPNGEDAVTTVTGNLFKAHSPENFEHDADGNLLKDGRWTYTWNGENRLIEMENLTNLVSDVPRIKLEFEYDYMGRRTMKTVLNLDLGTTNQTEFVYNGWNLISEVGRTVPGEPVSTNRYVWGLDLSQTMQGAGGVGGLLSIVFVDPDNTSSAMASFDGNGNLTGLVDVENSQSVATYEYDPFGSLIRSTGVAADENPFRFSTKYQDTETGLSYYGLRLLDSDTGRWLNRDPTAETGGINLYGFVGNDGVGEIDFLGLCSVVLSTLDASGNAFDLPQNSTYRDLGIVNSSSISLGELKSKIEIERSWFIPRKIRYIVYIAINYQNAPLLIDAMRGYGGDRGHVSTPNGRRLKTWDIAQAPHRSQVSGSDAVLMGGFRELVAAHEYGHAKVYIENFENELIPAINGVRFPTVNGLESTVLSNYKRRYIAQSNADANQGVIDYMATYGTQFEYMSNQAPIVVGDSPSNSVRYEDFWRLR